MFSPAVSVLRHQFKRALPTAAELSGLSDLGIFPGFLEFAIFGYYRGYLGVGRVSNGFGAPWRFIWTEFQPENFILEPVRVDFPDFRWSGTVLGYPWELCSCPESGTA